MSKPVILRPAADRDLDEIVRFLRKESRQAAQRFAEAIVATVQVIGDHPGISSTRHAEICPELPARLRFHPVAQFPRILVYYVERKDVVEIIRIWDAARGLEALTAVDDDKVMEPRTRYVSRDRPARQVNSPSASPPDPA